MAYLRIRRGPAGALEEVTWQELEAAIRSGELGPQVLVWNEMATHKEWWTLDNLRLFHQNSPERHPPGEHLAAVFRVEAHRAEQERRLSETRRAYSSGELIESAFGLRSLGDIVAEPGVQGVSRLFLLPSFEPEKICTLVFTRHQLRCELATAATSLWHSIPQFVASRTPDGLWQETVGQRFDRRQVQRDAWALDAGRAPPPFRTWEELRSAAKAAPACERDVLDGIGFRHKLQEGTVVVDVRWDNPDPWQHPAQVGLIRAYMQLSMQT